ncbi:MAG UNVERIFIED_CONTAM: hypothetical protein LVQ98_04190 [Rickettsiaceae bacterium]
MPELNTLAIVSSHNGLMNIFPTFIMLPSFKVELLRICSDVFLMMASTNAITKD